MCVSVSRALAEAWSDIQECVRFLQFLCSRQHVLVHCQAALAAGRKRKKKQNKKNVNTQQEQVTEMYDGVQNTMLDD